MRSVEDHFIERKTWNDMKDCLKTLVAFANSTPPDQSSVLYIGVTDSGKIEGSRVDIDGQQRRLNTILEKAYPPIHCIQMVLHEEDKHLLVVIVPYSANRPHFAGPAYIRSGSASIEASEGQFQELLESRTSKIRRILQHKGNQVTVANLSRNGGESYWPGFPCVVDCNQQYITLGDSQKHDYPQTFPMSQIDIGFDHASNQLKIIIQR
jgi:hypothetical protein